MYTENRMKSLELNLKKHIKDSLSYKIDTHGAYLNDILMHSERVTAISMHIAKSLKLSESQQKELLTAGIFHDIGKAIIPKNILFKKGKLSEFELCIVKSHPSRGADFLSKNGYSAEIVDAARYHHEKYDGTGYPTGISGHDIPLFARIISIADAYDAIVSPRVYKEPKKTLYAVNEILRCSGTQFDPEIAERFVWMHNQLPCDDENILFANNR